MTSKKLLMLVSAVVVTLAGCKPRQFNETAVDDASVAADDGKVYRARRGKGTQIPKDVDKFLNSFRTHSRGKPYVYGASGPYGMDCSGSITYALKQAQLVSRTYGFHGNMDYDSRNFTTCPRRLRPGDIMLIGYPGRSPDHWIVIEDVKEGVNWERRTAYNWASFVTNMMDQSSDYGTFHEGPVRGNIARRQIFACIRHKRFSAGWQKLIKDNPKLANFTKAVAEADDKPIETAPRTVLDNDIVLQDVAQRDVLKQENTEKVDQAWKALNGGVHLSKSASLKTTKISENGKDKKEVTVEPVEQSEIELSRKTGCNLAAGNRVCAVEDKALSLINFRFMSLGAEYYGKVATLVLKDVNGAEKSSTAEVQSPAQELGAMTTNTEGTVDVGVADLKHTTYSATLTIDGKSVVEFKVTLVKE